MANAHNETPRNLAKRLFDKNKRNKEKTVAEIIIRADSQKTLRDFLIKQGATTLIGSIVVTDRAEVLQRLPDEYAPDIAPNVGVAAPSRGLSAQAAVRKSTRGATIMALLNFPLPTPGNKLLREANAEEVFEAAQHYRGTANNALKHASWLSAVAKQLPKGKVVGDVFDNRRLNALYKNTDGSPPLRVAA